MYEVFKSQDSNTASPSKLTKTSSWMRSASPAPARTKWTMSMTREDSGDREGRLLSAASTPPSFGACISDNTQWALWALGSYKFR